jgi:flagellar assembly protein FliH
MSYRAQRLPDQPGEPFPWEPVILPGIASEGDVRSIEHEAFAKGYEQGERAGLATAATQTGPMLQQLEETINSLVTLRREIVRRTERQTVQLVLALAEQVVQREVTLDRTLLIGMARSALDRLGEYGSATIRLHPDDFKAVEQPHEVDGTSIRVTADPAVNRGGCQVDSDFGFMDASPDAQFRELARGLLMREGGDIGGGSTSR